MFLVKIIIGGLLFAVIAPASPFLAIIIVLALWGLDKAAKTVLCLMVALMVAALSPILGIIAFIVLMSMRRERKPRYVRRTIKRTVRRMA